MKKVIAILLLVCMVAGLAACGSKPAEYKLGMGVVVSTDSSAENNAQVDATVATVVTDKDGKIVACRIDCAQSKMDVTDGGVDTAKTFLTKAELKEDYNMVKFSAPGACIAEWYIQAKAFTDFVVGMTAADILAMETVLNEEGHQVSTDETLFASCTISIGGFQAVLAKAADNAR